MRRTKTFLTVRLKLTFSIKFDTRQTKTNPTHEIEIDTRLTRTSPACEIKINFFRKTWHDALNSKVSKKLPTLEILWVKFDKRQTNKIPTVRLRLTFCIKFDTRKKTKLDMWDWDFAHKIWHETNKKIRHVLSRLTLWVKFDTRQMKTNQTCELKINVFVKFDTTRWIQKFPTVTRKEQEC